MVITTDRTPLVASPARLEAVSDDEKVYEIIDGKPEEKIVGGARHGGIGMRLGARLTLFVEENQLGAIYGPDTTFKIGENQRLPDLAFVAADRIPPEGEPEGIWELAPDLAVEIVSPTDLYEKVIRKLVDYFAAGMRLVWLISPENRQLTVYTSPTQAIILTDEDELICDDVVPGFRCRLADIFRLVGRVER